MVRPLGSGDGRCCPAGHFEYGTFRVNTIAVVRLGRPLKSGADLDMGSPVRAGIPGRTCRCEYPAFDHVSEPEHNRPALGGAAFSAQSQPFAAFDSLGVDRQI
jgi:hypothetical protein